MFRIGLLSDTHGLLRPEAKAFLKGSDHIIHAGDIGDPKILEELALLAPVTAVRGNNDKGIWPEMLPVNDFLKVGEVFIYVLHDLAELEIDPVAEGVQIVVTGHSHKPLVSERGGVLYVNPGSAVPRRFKLPIAVAEVIVSGRSVSARIVELKDSNKDKNFRQKNLISTLSVCYCKSRGPTNLPAGLSSKGSWSILIA